MKLPRVISKGIKFNSDSESDNSENDLIQNPGDRLEYRMTKTERKVLKISKDNGDSKYSATKYKNGTIVETKVTKNSKNKY